LYWGLELKSSEDEGDFSILNIVNSQKPLTSHSPTFPTPRSSHRTYIHFLFRRTNGFADRRGSLSTRIIVVS